ncbi:transposase [Streptomyces sp. NPDC051597]|uniref:transposase n=1 Tax=Streptomyces sp. NPDC051597 TaxID=3155049 RepID=UPI00341ACE23
MVKAVNRSTILDEYWPYPHQRRNEGCHDTAQLHRDSTDLGFTGSIQAVRRYLRTFTPSASAPAPRPAPRPAVVRWTMTNPGNLTDEGAFTLKEIRAGCPALDAVTDHIRDFAEIVRDLHGDQLPGWIEDVEQDPLRALHSLVNGPRRDQDAVIAGLSTPWSAGQVEGQNMRAKLVKRTGFGRANIDLLRKRILYRT